MPPKKREKDTESSKNPRLEHIQADHELFLQAFEKPTQIYRFLRTRNMLSPIFLYRTLSYMRQRMSRTHKNRRGFKVDSILERVKRNQNTPQLSGYMTLTFLGFYDKKGDTHEEPVKVETLLLKICHKKRKDVSSPVSTLSVGTCHVPYNPSEDKPPATAPAISISADNFCQSNGHIVKSYHLLLRVGSVTSNILTPNGELDSEPPQKKRKCVKTASGEDIGAWHQYGTDLIIYDKQNRCLLSDGDYELLLEELNSNPSAGSKISHNYSSWESIGPIKDVGYLTKKDNKSIYREPSVALTSFEKFSSGPILKFRLKWSKEPIKSHVDRPKPLYQINDPLDNNSNKENNKPERAGKPAKEEGSSPNSSKLQIVYQFLYNNNSRQQTEACDNVHCPWCTLDCKTLYALLKHLKLCHSRFTFTYVPLPQGARIDVAINETYDGSYTGPPQDLVTQPPGMAFSRNGPVRRTVVSNILVCHPKRPRPSLSEFLELDENEFDGQRPYITGHNRLYHHTTTCLPIYPKEMEIDSEDENDPKWLQTKTMMMIDDFTDVNEGEKELMKMWNLHVMRHGYVGDCQIPLACTMFLQNKGQELLMKNLYRNFVLHMCNLFDFGLISPVIVYNTIKQLQELLEEHGDASKILQDSVQAQRKQWILEGANKPSVEPRRITSSPAQGAAERRKPAHFSPQPKDKSGQRVQRNISPPPENVSKKRTTDQPVRSNDSVTMKKKSVTGKTNTVAPNANSAEKKKEMKTEGGVKRKLSMTAAPQNQQPQQQHQQINKTNQFINKDITSPTVNKDVKDSSSVKLRRKSSSSSLRETSVSGTDTNNPVVVLRRKSFAGATDTLRKKAVENGVSNIITNIVPSENRRKDIVGTTPNKTSVS